MCGFIEHVSSYLRPLGTRIGDYKVVFKVVFNNEVQVHDVHSPHRLNNVDVFVGAKCRCTIKLVLLLYKGIGWFVLIANFGK